ncbi:MAG TPA: TonB-dependent receptor, partial [Terriglobales bacterium]|nr:TonB-dependent receptor [Terriglobales bacterium]
MPKQLLIVLVLAGLAVAQATSGGLEGRVLDPTGAVIAGARVKARNVASGAQIEVTTDAGGRYRMARLEPGRYEVSFVAQGFQIYSVAVQVRLGESANVSPELKVGSQPQTLTVREFGVAVDTANTTQQSVITQEEIAELPLQQRSFTDLMVLVPGIRPQGSFARNKARAGTFSVNGSDGRNSEVNLDGIDNRDYIFGGYLQALPLSTVQEYRVTTANGTPEDGRTNGAMVDVVSRAGATGLHGNAFFLARHDKLAARNFFEARDNAPDAPSSRQHLGGAVGAGITAKLFFWAGAEILRDRDSNFVTDAALAELALVPGAVARRFLPRPYDDRSVSGRLDWLPNDHNHFFLRLAGQHNDGHNELMGEPAAADESNGNRTTNRYLSAALAWTHTFSASALNDLRFGFADARSEIQAASTAPNLAFAVESVPGLPDTPAVQIGANQNTPGVFYQRRWQVRDDISLARGRHHFSFGASELYMPRLGGLFLFGSLGYTIFFFDRPSVIAGNTTLYPQGFATPGAVREILLSTGDGSFQQSTNLFALYFNDRIRLTPTLTLNFGLRYDLGSGFYPDMSRDRAFVLLRQIDSPLAARQPEDPKTMLQPRVGLAWNPDGEGRSVVRLSYGIFFDTIIQQFTFPSLQRQNVTIFST